MVGYRYTLFLFLLVSRQPLYQEYWWNNNPTSRYDHDRTPDCTINNQYRVLPGGMSRTWACIDQLEVWPRNFDGSGRPKLYDRSTQRGGLIHLSAQKSFESVLSKSIQRLTGLINSKLDQSFEFSMYNWTPQTRESAPSMQLDELIGWLTTVVDSLSIKEQYKDEAYKGAFEYIADTLMVSYQS